MKEILEILEKDARLTPQQLAEMTGKPVAEVENTIKQAERDRIILKYKTVIDWSKVGEEQVWALVEVKIVPQRDVGFDAMAERIYLFPQARSVFLSSGTYDLAILVCGKTMQDIAVFISQKLAPLETVQSTVTHFILKKYKEDGEILTGGDDNRRQQITL
jgi:DNA-binding Lrp family transcriptional regulator